MMNDEDLRQATLDYTLRLGDDSLVLGQRISEWVSNGPFLEEDIAFGNVALDYIGRARMFYGYAAELAADGRSEDDFAYLRGEREFRNYLLHELPRGDFAFSQMRQLVAGKRACQHIGQIKHTHARQGCAACISRHLPHLGRGHGRAVRGSWAEAPAKVRPPADQASSGVR